MDLSALPMLMVVFVSILLMVHMAATLVMTMVLASSTNYEKMAPSNISGKKSMVYVNT